jgi:hypothetical protein
MSLLILGRSSPPAHNGPRAWTHPLPLSAPLPQAPPDHALLYRAATGPGPTLPHPVMHHRGPHPLSSTRHHRVRPLPPFLLHPRFKTPPSASSSPFLPFRMKSAHPKCTAPPPHSSRPFVQAMSSESRPSPRILAGNTAFLPPPVSHLHVPFLLRIAGLPHLLSLAPCYRSHLGPSTATVGAHCRPNAAAPQAPSPHHRDRHTMSPYLSLVARRHPLGSLVDMA